MNMIKAAMAASALPKRQSQVLKLLALGLLNKEMAARLNISVNTVRNTRRVIYLKMGVNNSVEAARAAAVWNSAKGLVHLR